MSTSIPIVIDCDPGIDDALALLLALGSPELSLQAVTCVAGNRPVEQTTLNARRVLDLAGAHQVPVHAGCARPLAQPDPCCNLVHGADGLGGLDLPLQGPLEAEHAVDALLRLLHAHPPGTLRLVAIGPLTNLALAEIKRPGVLRRAAQLDIMGGAAFVPGNVQPQAEFNFYADPLAAQTVLASGARIQLYGLDVTTQAVMGEAWIESLASLPGRAAQAACVMLQAYASHDRLLHDVCPVAGIALPQLFSAAPHRARVEWRAAESEGRLIAEADAASPLQLVTGVDTDALLDRVRQALSRLP
jgi:purine nucleosidase